MKLYNDNVINKRKGAYLMEILYFLNAMTLWAALFFAVGFILVIVEMFIPGFGVPGIVGSICLFIGVLLTAKTLLQAAILIVIILFILAIALTVILNSATKGKLSKTLVLNDSLNKEAGFVGTEDLDYFINKEGITLSVLRPAGTGDFEGVKLDIVSEGEFIQKDSKVKIVKIQGRKILVKKIN